MSGTTNLNAPYISAGQNQKEVTHAAALDRFDAAMTAAVAASVASGNYTFSDPNTYRACAIVNISGATTAGRTVTLPAIRKPIIAALDTASTKSVAIVRGSSSFALFPGCRLHLYGDGTGLTRIAEFGPQRTVTWVTGSPDADEILVRFKVQEASILIADLLGWQSVADVAADATPVFSVRKNGSEVGTLTWAATGTTPTLATAANATVSFAAGDYFDIKAPSSPDATLSDIFIHHMLVRV
jgi:hypothetical protein